MWRLIMICLFPWLSSTGDGLAAPPEIPASAPKECLFERPAKARLPRICIRPQSYSRDLCRALEQFSAENDLPPEFFARLIWRESLFRADAVSYKGAEGIAQFMPGTA